MQIVHSILDFWFAPAHQAYWFKSTPAFDEEIKSLFGVLHADARKGDLDGWIKQPESALALVILLDQFPRNMYRDSPAAFESDAQALAVTKQAIAAGLDLQLTHPQRRFLYMPFMHSEMLAEQDRGIALFDALGHPESAEFMRRHRDIIAKYGRFPHRNAILGRQSSPQEQAFLQQPGSSF